VRERIAEPIEQMESLDAVLGPLQKAVQTVVPERSELKDVLSGTWLGEPLHPPLTDVLIGTWTSALLLDLLGGEQAAAVLHLPVQAAGPVRRSLPGIPARASGALFLPGDEVADRFQAEFLVQGQQIHVQQQQVPPHSHHLPTS